METKSQLPDFNERVRELINAHFNDADRALCGLGDFILRPEWVRHRLTSSVWFAVTERQRERAVAACFRLPTNTPTFTSSDGAYTVPTTPAEARNLISASLPGMRKLRQQHASDHALLLATNQILSDKLRK